MCVLFCQSSCIFRSQLYMSVVRDILGVPQAALQSTSPLAAVMSSIGLSTAPAPKPGRKRKSFASLKTKEIEKLRDSENLIISPIATPETPQGGRQWKFRPFRNSAREDDVMLSHWDNREDLMRDYSAARCKVPVQLPPIELADESVWSKHGLNRDQFVHVFDLLQTFELNFVLVADRLNFPLSVEQIKDMYYSLYSIANPGKKCKYSFANDVERKRLLQDRQASIAAEGRKNVTEMNKSEKRILGEVKELEERLKVIDGDAALIDRVVLAPGEGKKAPTTPSGKKGSTISGCSLASAEKKPTGADLVNKFLPGFPTPPPTGRRESVAAADSSTAIVLKQTIDMSAIKQIGTICTSFNSKRINDFFQQLNDLAEAEKSLTAFIRKRESELRAVSKS